MPIIGVIIDNAGFLWEIIGVLYFIQKKEAMMPKIYQGMAFVDFLKAKFIPVAEQVFSRYLEFPERPHKERTGAYLSALDKLKGEASWKRPLQVSFGTFPPESKSDLSKLYCEVISLEKVDRLVHRNLEYGDISSFQTLDRELKRFGGAITAPDDSEGTEEGRRLVIGIAGLDGHGEEAIMLVSEMICGWMTFDDAKRIMDLSGNEQFIPLLEICNDLFQR